MSEIICPSCSNRSPAGTVFCDNCGYDLRNVAPAAPAQAGFTPPTVAASACASCGHPNVAGAAFCENCGAQLSQAQAPQAPQAPAYPPQPAYTPPPAPPAYVPPATPAAPPPPAYTPPPAPPAYSPPVSPTPVAPAFVVGRLLIQAANTSLAIPPGKSEVLIGREDPVSGIFPEIDLDPHGGQDAGVGRRHAKLIAQAGQVLLEDLNSVNGTALNRQKLPAGQPRPVNNGDEIRLGKMVLIYYSS